MHTEVHDRFEHAQAELTLHIGGVNSSAIVDKPLGRVDDAAQAVFGATAPGHRIPFQLGATHRNRG